MDFNTKSVSAGAADGSEIPHSVAQGATGGKLEAMYNEAVYQAFKDGSTFEDKQNALELLCECAMQGHTGSIERISALASSYKIMTQNTLGTANNVSWQGLSRIATSIDNHLKDNRTVFAI